MAKIGIVLLAAGSSSRMGSPKQLLPFQGKPLIRHAAETALATRCERVIVVLGCRSGDIRPSVQDLPVQIVENESWEEGMASSIQAGINAAAAQNLDGVILALADQPLVSASMLDRLIDSHLESGRPLVASQYASTVGVPVLFAKELFAPLMALRGQQGCKGVILAHLDQAVMLPCPEAEIDVDTPEDYRRAESAPPR